MSWSYPAILLKHLTSFRQVLLSWDESVHIGLGSESIQELVPCGIWSCQAPVWPSALIAAVHGLPQLAPGCQQPVEEFTTDQTDQICLSDQGSAYCRAGRAVGGSHPCARVRGCQTPLAGTKCTSGQTRNGKRSIVSTPQLQRPRAEKAHGRKPRQHPPVSGVRQRQPRENLISQQDLTQRKETWSRPSPRCRRVGKIKTLQMALLLVRLWLWCWGAYSDCEHAVYRIKAPTSSTVYGTSQRVLVITKIVASPRAQPLTVPIALLLGI
ncbi:uncharacterized protein LOC122466272 [Chelonia mydas]|uniref:uncharacterized protein LOC122466272 n=1 Tax=Chelonia mydas TaxID=8469 RepID=UPI001CA9FC66|nr:uncharacterized protein LOC122466272 [Chelonia mydas]